MGMFDDVNHPAEPCPRCGKMVGGWQTKSRPDPSMEMLEPSDIIGGAFYSFCDACHTWINYEVVPVGPIPYTLRRTVKAIP